MSGAAPASESILTRADGEAVGGMAPSSGSRTPTVMLGLGVLLVASSLLAIGLGAVPIAPGQTLAILFSRVGIDLSIPFSAQEETVLLAIRLPRLLLGLCVGASLSVCGAVLQGLFRNPLAEQGLIGVSSGAALGAAMLIVLEGAVAASLPAPLAIWLVPLGAFTGGLLATGAVYRLASSPGRTDMTTMLLAGIALNALVNAGLGLLIYLANDAQLRTLTTWMLGSLSGATWRALGTVGPLCLAGMLATTRFASRLNLLLLGEAEARHLGMDVHRTRRWLVILCALMVGAGVSVTGIIGFVGLVVPHLLRLMIGPDHRGLLAGCALLGAALLVLADLLARTLVAPAEMPIGIVTSILGSPFFLWLLVKDRRERGA